MSLEKLNSSVADFYAAQDNKWSNSVNREPSEVHKMRLQKLNNIINQDTYDTYTPSSSKNEKETLPLSERIKSMIAKFLEQYIKKGLEDGTINVISIDDLAKECLQDEIEKKGLQGVLEDIIEEKNITQDEIDKKGLLGALEDRIPQNDVDNLDDV